MVVNQDSADYDFRVESNANSHMLFVDAGNNQVKINTTSTSAPSAVELVVGGGIHVSYADDIALSYQAGTYSNYYKGMSGKNPYNDVGRGLHIFNYDNDSDTGINFWSGSSESSSLYSIANFEAGATGEVVFNGSGFDRDFRVESDNNANMFVVDAGSDRVQIGSQIFGQAPTVGRGQFVSFNTDITTVSASGSVTKNLFTRSPDSNVAATGTVYISAENSGGSIQVGCIIDFFFSNGTLSTTARETGSSQGTMTFSAQENGDAISVTVAYAGGLGGAIRFNAGGHASIASY